MEKVGRVTSVRERSAPLPSISPVIRREASVPDALSGNLRWFGAVRVRDAFPAADLEMRDGGFSVNQKLVREYGPYRTDSPRAGLLLERTQGAGFAVMRRQ